MLNFQKIEKQLKEFANHLAWKRSEEVPAIRRALEEACHWSEKVETLREKVKVSRTSWLTVVPDEPLNRSYDPPPDPNQYVVIATDGSQVLPDRTEAPPFYLINIGHAVLSYGTGDPPHLTSHPYLFVKDEDLSRVWSLTEVPLNWETVSLRRQLSEWTALKDLAEAVSRRPALALIDGSLILWNLEGKPPDVRNAHLSASLNLLDQLRQLGVPVAGFISSPASKDIINTLRVAICPYDRPDCDRCEWLLTRQVPPCAVIEGMDDAALYFEILKPGQRSPVFFSSSRILSEYGDHRICFFYLRTGFEVARVEFPAWVRDLEGGVAIVHSLVWDQVLKGQGYPIALIEAHQFAVVHPSEREGLLSLLTDLLRRRGLSPAISGKFLAKRRAPI